MHKESKFEEVELKDYLKVLNKWKKLIILGTLCCVLIAGIASYLIPPVYRVSTLLEIGTISRTGVFPLGSSDIRERIVGLPFLIEKPAALSWKIGNGVYDERIHEKLNIKEKKLPKIKVKTKKNTLLLELSIKTTDKEKGEKILETLNNLVIEDHSEVTAVEKESISRKIQQIDNEISQFELEEEAIKRNLILIQNNNEQISKKIKELSEKTFEAKAKHPNQYEKSYVDLILSLLLSSSEVQEVSLKNRLSSGKKEVRSLHLEKERLTTLFKAIKDTRNIMTKDSQGKAVWPDKRLTVVVASVLALTILVLVSFFMDYLKGARVK